MKGGQTAGIVVEMLKNGGISIIDWLLRIVNRCTDSGVVTEDWKAECIIPIHKGKVDRTECKNYRGKI